MAAKGERAQPSTGPFFLFASVVSLPPPPPPPSKGKYRKKNGAKRCYRALHTHTQTHTDTQVDLARNVLHIRANTVFAPLYKKRRRVHSVGLLTLSLSIDPPSAGQQPFSWTRTRFFLSSRHSKNKRRFVVKYLTIPPPRCT